LPELALRPIVGMVPAAALSFLAFFIFDFVSYWTQWIVAHPIIDDPRLHSPVGLRRRHHGQTMLIGQEAPGLIQIGHTTTGIEDRGARNATH